MSTTSLRTADEPRPGAGARIDETVLVGRWRNADTDALPPAIRAAEVVRRDGRLYLSLSGVDGFDWGAARVEGVFAGNPGSKVAAGLTATFELAQRRMRVHCNIKLGVAVLAGFVRFSDGSGRPPTFIRDFLYRPGSEVSR